MSLTNIRSKRRFTGARVRGTLVARLKNRASPATLTKLAETRRDSNRVLAGKTKWRMVSANTCNLYDPKSKKHLKASITLTTENSASRHYVRRNILTKGSIIETEKGKARITNRPGQEGAVNAILLS
jgi:small subunit ribosomal protein S8e